MYSSLISVLLLGMWPGVPVTAEQLHASSIDIAPPTQSIRVDQHLSASGVLILDAESGETVFAKQGAIKRPMASITKLMTALIIVENHDVRELVTIPRGAPEVIGAKVYLPAGEQFTVGSLLSALLISSANDAAIALAHHHSGSTEAFVAAMNTRAEKLGLLNTSYANPTGLDSVRQYSTPREIAFLAKSALQEPEIAKRMQRRWDRIYSMQGTDIPLNHTHALLHTQPGRSSTGGSAVHAAASASTLATDAEHRSMSYVSAGKTGTTYAAGECLVSVVEHKKREYIVVLLHSGSRYADLRIILETMDASLV